MILLAAASHSTLNVTPAAQLIVHIQGDRTRCQEPVSTPTKTRDSARGASDFRTGSRRSVHSCHSARDRPFRKWFLTPIFLPVFG